MIRCAKGRNPRLSDWTLVIGNRNYSSWSLRPWLLLRALDIPFQEVRVALGRPDTAQQIALYSPAGRVPVLREGTRAIWDSLAICEYVAEVHSRLQAWPADAQARAVARSVSAEMHSGFGALRQALPMNCRASGRRVPIGPEVARDIARIQQIWRDCRGEFGAGGPWLFGRFSIADAMFAPVALRFVTYGIDGDATAQAFVRTVREHPAVREWVAAARAETEVMADNEVGGEGCA
jgi:glutathione S-transferase